MEEFMFGQLDYGYWISVFLCIICWFIMRLVEKLINRPMQYISIFVMCLAVFLFQTKFVLINFDADGNQYSFVDWKDGDYKKATYYTEDGEPFIVQENKIVSKKEPKKIFDINKTYLDEKGNLIFDIKNEYKSTWQRGVYSSANQTHVYSLALGNWNVFGNFVSPEAKRIKVGKYYISPCFLDIEEDRGYPGKLTFLLVESYSIVLIGIYLFILGVFIVKGITLKEQKFTLYNWFPNVMTAIMIMLQVFIVSGDTKSFPDLILRWITYLAIVCKIIPILQGSIQIESNYDDTEKKIFIKDALQATDKDKVHKWRSQFIRGSSISLICWIIISIIYSIQSYNTIL